MRCNTVSLVLVTTTACVVVGVGAAWLVERTELPAARWWRLALVAPLAVPAFVNAYAPEHLELLSEEPFIHLGHITEASEILMGTHTPVSIANFFI